MAGPQSAWLSGGTYSLEWRDEDGVEHTVTFHSEVEAWEYAGKHDIVVNFAPGVYRRTMTEAEIKRAMDAYHVHDAGCLGMGCSVTNPSAKANRGSK